MNIGLIAHDAKKTLLQNLCIAYRSVLAKHTLYATGTSGRLVEEATGLNVRKYLAGHVGGVQQMGSQIEQNDLDLVIFLRDPEQPKQHEPDVHRIIRLCDVHSIPLATNLATAEMLIKSLDRGEMDWRLVNRLGKRHRVAFFPFLHLGDQKGNSLVCNLVNLLADSADRIDSLLGNRRTVEADEFVIVRQGMVFADQKI